MKYVPFMICVIVFIFTSAGYFITDKKTEKIYGALSIVSIACAIVQAAIVFWKIKAENRIPDEKLGIRFFVVRLAAHVSNGLKSRIRPVVGRI